ncbi:hypothetical protein ACFQL7_28555 [Halocatena marina]|uniref:Uncharacterized protein n=2 Tax=Halocatena marina TaxID=2934937 RepID=A0ABD5YVL4_9EURY
MMNHPKLYEHFKSEGFDVPDGIYRVVGRDGEATVTLLRVADVDERRAYTGEIVTTSLEELESLTLTENPDGNLPLRTVLTSNVDMIYWSLRVFIQQLAANPFPTTVAVTLVAVGAFGEQIFSLPEIVFSSFVLLGSLGLAYVGSGRL